MPRKKPNKFLKINDKVVTLPKAAMGRGSRVYPNGRSSSNPFEEREKAATVINQFVEVRADAITKNQDSDNEYSLRFPRFMRFRGFEIGEKI